MSACCRICGCGPGGPSRPTEEDAWTCNRCDLGRDAGGAVADFFRWECGVDPAGRRSNAPLVPPLYVPPGGQYEEVSP